MSTWGAISSARPLPFLHTCVGVCTDQLALSPTMSSSVQYDETELMQQWFDVVHEKNVLAGYESELVIQSVVWIISVVI